jgi:hypothetical protein
MIDTCESMGSQKDRCYKIFDSAKSGASGCRELDDIVEKDICYLINALNKKDVDFCNSIITSSWKDSCFGSISAVTLNASLCERATDDTNRAYCYMAAGLLIRNCEKLNINEPYIAYCEYFSALETLDFSLCHKITDETIKKFCFNDIIKQAVKDPSICDNPQNQLFRDQCLKAIE